MTRYYIKILWCIYRLSREFQQIDTSHLSGLTMMWLLHKVSASRLFRLIETFIFVFFPIA